MEQQNRKHEEEGASLIEYALLVALIAVVCFASVVLLGETVSGRFSSIASGVASL